MIMLKQLYQEGKGKEASWNSCQRGNRQSILGQDGRSEMAEVMSEQEQGTPKPFKGLCAACADGRHLQPRDCLPSRDNVYLAPLAPLIPPVVAIMPAHSRCLRKPQSGSVSHGVSALNANLAGLALSRPTHLSPIRPTSERASERE